jgi:hypothetical protein
MRTVRPAWSHAFLVLPGSGWIPFWEEISRSEIVEELLQDPSYGDVTYRVDYGAFCHDIDSVRPGVVKINPQ